MQRLRRKLFKKKKSTNDKNKNNDDEDIYLQPEYDDSLQISPFLDLIAEELLSLAKKSSHTIRLAKLRDDVLAVKSILTRKLTQNAKQFAIAHRQIDSLQRQLIKRNETDEGSLRTRHNRSFASDHSGGDSASCHSIWSPNSSILSSSITTPTFRRRLAESSVADIHHSSIVQEHFANLYHKLCSNCLQCSCYQIYLREEIEFEYLSLYSLCDQFKAENDLLQRLLADCKYSYEQQHLAFSQYEQYLIEYEQCIQIQHELIRTLEQLIDRLESKRTRIRDEEISGNHIYQRINDVITTMGIGHDGDDAEFYRILSLLHDQCRQCLSRIPKRLQLFSHSREHFHPPPNISGIVDVADLEVAVLLVDLLTLKHENCELRWTGDRLLHEKKAYKAKIDHLETMTKNRRDNKNEISSDNNDELIRREKMLRIYVYRLYELLQITSKQLKERQDHCDSLVQQFKERNGQLVEHIRRTEKQRQYSSTNE